jgi:PTS system nitrogen regulatory IIA component
MVLLGSRGRAEPPDRAAEGAVDELLAGLGYPVFEVPPAACTSRDAAITFLVGALARAGGLPGVDTAALIGQLLKREEVGSTGIGRGLALPHTATDAVGQVVGAVGRARDGIRWDGSFDELPVRHVCLLLTPAACPRTTLLAQERVVRHLFRSPARDQAIRQRAYRYWEQAGRPDGNDKHFWFAAERDLLANT